MHSQHSYPHTAAMLAVLSGLILLIAACNPTKHVEQGQYLLRNNSLKIKADKSLTNKGELTDALNSLIIQKPNTYFLKIAPYKVSLYNMRYKRYQRDTAAENFQKKLRTVERPVIFDSTLVDRSLQHMRAHLFNQGYFYSKVTDTAIYHRRKVRVFYQVETGMRYLINKTLLDIDDSDVASFVRASMGQSALQTGKPFAMTMGEEERSRITNVLRNKGYYKFSTDNIHVLVDTFNKSILKDVANPFESALNYIDQQHKPKQATVDLHIIIRKADEPKAYQRFKIGKLSIYPDFVDRKDIRDSSLRRFNRQDVNFSYHNYFVREKVLLNQIFLRPGDYFTQDNYDLTITKLNELGVFQYVQTYIIEDSTLPKDRSLRCIILMNPTKRYDFSLEYEVSSGTTYTLGNSVGINFRNRNLLKGANQLSISMTGGLELGYSNELADKFVDRFYLLSRNAGVNATLDFPKLIAPFSLNSSNTTARPHTILGLGTNILDRVDYFTLINTTASITYNWHQRSNITWDFSPAFINILRLPRIADTFQRRLDSNEFLRNSYRQSFIEGESIYFNYNNSNGPNARRHYSSIRAGFEESGGLLSALNSLVNLENSLGLRYSQYVKFEADARHYIRRQHYSFAMRFFAGIGLPYDKSTALPYIKQYFVGGPYSLRGYRVRQLGPGSYYDSTNVSSNNFIDRTADIKLEANAEYRFDIIQMFGGALHLNGAAFVDAGNIWLAKPSPDYPNGEFALNKLGSDVTVSTGLGVRFDISGLFVIRVDEGFPIKNPAYPVHGGWVGNEIQFFNSDWRYNNLVLHIAIGYPF